MPGISVSTRLCAVIGDPVGHSLSPVMHNAAFEAAGLDYVYLAFEVKDVGACAAGMRALPSFEGLSVTIPHKTAIMEHMDAIDPMAARVGSVNTVARDGARLIGLTTDGPGALKAFTDAGEDLGGREVLFTGAGGAVRAVVFAVAELAQPAGVTILGRNAAKARTLAQEAAEKTGVPVRGGALDRDLEDAMAKADAIVQGTPVGMHPNPGASCIPAELLRPEQVVFDMVYRPHKTQLLQDAETKGCTIIVGIEMLVNQAELQFERWTGQAPPAGVMRAAALDALGVTGDGAARR